jgi:tetratricopeptide (TPR) repeat protein
LALTEKSLGHEHPETANVLVHLGLALTAQGRPESAFAVYERALWIRKRALGEEHPDVAVTLAHWAAALRAAGRGSDAAQLEERARETHSARGPASAGGYTVDVETLLKESAGRP